MKNIIEIMKNDFTTIIKNPIVILVLMALLIIPSLYAVLNVDACWDMYGNTGELSFAIANLDKGSTYDDTKLNVGNDLVDELKNNTDFKWTFTNEDDLHKGVENGTYYAGIVIPKNFSKQIVSITTDNPESAKLQYYNNEKTNPIASKLADTGAKEVYRTMNAKVVQFINLAAYGKLGELQSGLASGSTQLSYGAVQLQSGANQVSSGASQVSSGASKVSSGVSDVKSGASQVTSGASKVSSGASQVSSSAKKVSSGASQVSAGSKQVSSGASKVSSSSAQVQESAKQISSSVDTSKLPEGQVKQVVEGSVKLANASGQVAKGSSDVAAGSVKLANSSTQLANGASQVANGASSVASGASGVASGASKLANGSVALAEGSGQLAEGSLSLAAGSQLLANSAAYALFTASSSLSVAAGSLSDITGIDEDQLGDYFYSPIELNKTEIFPVSNFGSQLAPFYIVLSMWIGAIITSVMLKPGSSAETEYSPLEMYFGKLGLFIIMSVLQTVITLIGIFLLDVDIGNPLLFIFSSILVAATFMLLMYSFVSALGQVGKAVGVVLLVLQLSSTGGVYPIELMGPFFQIIKPYMPMTYAITLIRESMLGTFWPNYTSALVILIGFGIVTMIAAVLIKGKADDKAHYFENKIKKTGLF